MIPLYDEPTSIKNEFPRIVEKCVFCNTPTRTWHENTNSCICIKCASKYKVKDIPVDNGQTIRKKKRLGLFDREDSTRAN